MFSSASHLFHLAFLLDSGAPLEVRGRLARVKSGDEIRSIDVGEMSSTDVRIACARALRDAKATLSRAEWAAMCAQWGQGQTRSEGFAALLEACMPMTTADLKAPAVALFKDRGEQSPGARLLSGMRAALVAHGLSRLSIDAQLVAA